MLIRVQII